MTALNKEHLLDEMLGAAESVCKEQWPAVCDFARPELRKLATTLVQIHTLTVGGKLSEGEAEILLDLQKNTARTVMLVPGGMGLLAVDQAINAALGMVKNTVNTALGFPLL